MEKSPNKPSSKKSSERGLGRGLSALMSDMSALETVTPVKETAKPAQKNQSEFAEFGVKFVNISLIDRNPEQPRRYFDKDKLEELTQSIKDKGVLQPILVRPIQASNKNRTYQIVAGERRWQAALKAGLGTLPVLIRELSDQDVLEVGVVENVQRANLNPIEEALAYQALKTQFGRTQEDIARAIGKSRPYIANMMRLLTLPERAQSYLADGRLSAGHARAIIAAPDPAELADVIADKGLSVREAEDWVRRIKTANEKGTSPKARLLKSADTRKAEQQLMDILGLGVDLRHKGPSGELRIRYKNSAQLDDLIKRLSS